MEELIGEVTPEKDGLATKNNVRFRMTRSQEDIWYHFCSIKIGGKADMIFGVSAASETSRLFYSSFVTHNLSKSPYGNAYILFGFNENAFKLYSKKHDGMIDYYVNIVKDWISLKGMYISLDSEVNIILEEVPAPTIEELTEIPVQSIGG